MLIHRLFVGLLSFGLLACTAVGAEESVEEQVRSMGLREKVGQLFIIRPDALDGRFDLAELEDNSIVGTTVVTREMREAYAQYPCGGFAIFRKNILSAPQLVSLTEALHALGPVRPMLCIDEEGGSVARIANHPAGFGVRRFDPMGVIAASGDESLAYEAGHTIGGYLKAFGLDVDFAPVADVNTNPLNPVIGNRAFGSDPALAARMVAQAVRGLRDSGTAACLKHFPGHGDTSTDTHTGYAETLKTWEEISACEMVPFRAGIGAGAELVMTAHIAAPQVTGSAVPATMSRTLLTDKLRGELGFQGLIITDALSMGAIMQQYSSAEACVQCILAGADLLLMPYDYPQAFEGVLQAVQDGRIPESRIDESVTRILRFKQRQ